MVYFKILVGKTFHTMILTVIGEWIGYIFVGICFVFIGKAAFEFVRGIFKKRK